MMCMRALQYRLGAVVRRLRTDAGYSQEDFADHIGVHRSYMGLIERGQVAVTITTMEKLASGLGVPASRLLEAAEREPNQPAGTEGRKKRS